MICPQCKTANADDYVFCINCGATIGNTANALGPQNSANENIPETLVLPHSQVVIERPDLPSQPTVLHIETKRSSKIPLIVGILLVFLVIGTVGAYFVYRALSQEVFVTEKLPEHMGLFVKRADGEFSEIRRQETANVLEARDAIVKDPALQQVGAQPEIILYADAADISVTDLKFIRVDSITDDGKAKYIDVQAAIVDQKPAMKRIRFAQPLLDGKYAFALVTGFANEGKHRLWPVEVKGGAVNGSAFTQELSMTLKPTPTPTPTVAKTPENTQPPVGATVAYLTRKDVWLRKSPAIQDKGKLQLLKPRQKLFVIRYSENSDTWEDITSNWALVQTENGKQGWVFNAFLDHGKE